MSHRSFHIKDSWSYIHQIWHEACLIEGWDGKMEGKFSRTNNLQVFMSVFMNMCSTSWRLRLQLHRLSVCIFLSDFTDDCFFSLECYQMVLRWKAAVFRFIESKICVLPKISFKQLGSISMKVFHHILFIMFKFSHASKFTSQILWHCTIQHRLQKFFMI